MKSSTTIITAYFDIGRGDWTANKGFREKLARSVDVYFSYFERLAALENEMIIFTSPDLKPRVEAIRNGKPTTVIVIDIKKKFRYIRSRIEKIQKDDEGFFNLSLSVTTWGYLNEQILKTDQDNALLLRDGFECPELADVALRQRAGEAVTGGEFSAQRLDLAVMAQVASRVPMSITLRRQLAELKPFIREYRPLLVGVGAGAEFLRSARLTADVVVVSE
jgi:hypothetical protein